MARKNEYKTIQIPAELHKKLAKVSDELGLSVTKLATMVVASKLTELEKQDTIKISMKRSSNGDPELTLI